MNGWGVVRPWMLAPVSGGHFNPAVTWGLAITGKITVVRAVFYTGAQLTGRGFHSSISHPKLTSISHLKLSRFRDRDPPTAQRVPQKVLTSSQRVDECRPLLTGACCGTLMARSLAWLDHLLIQYPYTRSTTCSSNFHTQAHLPRLLTWPDLASRQTLKMSCRVTRYPISIWEMTISIRSSPISLAHIPYRYPG